MTGNPPEPVILITGAAARVGAAVARHLHSLGYRLILHYRHSAAQAQALQTELHTLRPDSVCLLQADLLDDAQIEKLAEQSLQCFGQLDVLINNASSFYPTPLGSIRRKQWDDLAGSNAWAPCLLIQALAPALTASAGCIINISDIYAARGRAQFAAYCMAKAALSNLTKSMARELAPAVRVNAIAPGIILPPNMQEESNKKNENVSGAGGGEGSKSSIARLLVENCLQRPGSPDDIAFMVEFLIRRGSYINGQTIRVDGGRSLLI